MRITWTTSAGRSPRAGGMRPASGDRRRSVRALLAAALLWTVTSSAYAQIDVPPMDMAGAMLNREALRVELGAIARGPDGRRGTVGHGRTGRVPAAPSRASGSGVPVRTGYRVDPAVTARVRGQFLDFVRRTSGPAGAEAVRRAFAQHDPLQNWARSVAPDGMRLGDAGDALTEYWVQNWMMANGVTYTPPAKVRAVRAQVQQVFGSSPAIARLNDAQRQELAEITIYNALLQGEAYLSAVKTRDRALLTRLGDAAQARMRNEMHLDVRRLALTNAGFVARG